MVCLRSEKKEKRRKKKCPMMFSSNLQARTNIQAAGKEPSQAPCNSPPKGDAQSPATLLQHRPYVRPLLRYPVYQCPRPPRPRTGVPMFIQTPKSGSGTLPPAPTNMQGQNVSTQKSNSRFFPSVGAPVFQTNRRCSSRSACPAAPQQASTKP
jgi:hypothetical protein